MKNRIKDQLALGRPAWIERQLHPDDIDDSAGLVRGTFLHAAAEHGGKIRRPRDENAVVREDGPAARDELDVSPL